MRARRLRPPDRGTRSRPTVQEGNTTAESPRLGHRILALLREHESLGYEQIAAHLEEPPHEVRAALSRLRGIGLVDAIAVGELDAHTTRAATYWRLTAAGRERAARPTSD